MMNRLLVNPATPHGKLSVELADTIYKAQQLSKRLELVMTQMAGPSPFDWAHVAKELGFIDIQGGDTAAQQAQTFSLLMLDVITAMNAAKLAEYVSRVDQGG
jgi:hypothetical protein